MRKFGLISTSIIISLSSITAASANGVVDNKKEFLSKVAGKKISQSSNTWLNASTNGKLSGKYKGINLSGNWTWEGGFWCRTGRIGLIPIPRECQQVTVNGKTLVLKRKKGKGQSFTYKIN